MYAGVRLWVSFDPGIRGVAVNANVTGFGTSSAEPRTTRCDNNTQPSHPIHTHRRVIREDNGDVKKAESNLG